MMPIGNHPRHVGQLQHQTQKEEQLLNQNHRDQGSFPALGRTDGHLARRRDTVMEVSKAGMEALMTELVTELVMDTEGSISKVVLQ